MALETPVLASHVAAGSRTIIILRNEKNLREFPLEVLRLYAENKTLS